MPGFSYLQIPLGMLALTLCWWLGHEAGTEQVRKQIDHLAQVQRLGWESEVATRQQALSDDIEKLRLQRDEARLTSRKLQRTISEKLELGESDRQELELYRRIAGTPDPGGLKVDSIFVEDGNTEEPVLAITLVHTRGRYRIKGRVGITLVGSRLRELAAARSLGDKSGESRQALPGEPLRLPIVSANSRNAPAFDMRFYETLRVPLTHASDMDVDLVEIDVVPAGNRQKAFQVVLPWDEIVSFDPNS